MAIKGLTDRGPQFPELGVLRKGAKKVQENKPGADLDYFRFDTKDQDALEAFNDEFGDQPREIEIKLPFATTDENFEAWKEEYSAGGLKHRCDGETCTQWLDKKTGKYRFDPITCPGGCKQTGRLKVIIPALERFAFVTVTTTSIWDIIEIHRNLTALEMLRGSLRGIPMILCRRQREISTPSDGGKRARRKKWLLSVEAAPEWVKLELKAQHQAALPPVTEPLMLGPGETDDDEDLEPDAHGPLGLEPEPAPEAEPGDHETEEEVEMITPDQQSTLRSIIVQLRQLGVTNEKLAEGLGSLTKDRKSVV